MARLLGCAAMAALSCSASADVATDGTVGRKVRLGGRNAEVGAELGQVRGRNLFHSFERFDVPAKGSVTFTGPRGLDNVISRVTGGKASRIDGTLASKVPGADVYLVNPSGIVFGPGARLDVPGSFHASTADELRFKDGGRFSAKDPTRGTLSVAAPESFGFLGGRPGAITVDRGVLAVGSGKQLSLVGGDVTVAGDASGPSFGDAPSGEDLRVRTSGVLRAPGGQVLLTSLGGTGTADLGGGASGTVSGQVRLSG